MLTKGLTDYQGGGEELHLYICRGVDTEHCNHRLDPCKRCEFVIFHQMGTA